MKKLILLSVIAPFTMTSCFWPERQNPKIWIAWHNEKRDKLYPHIYNLFSNSTDWTNIINDGLVSNSSHKYHWGRYSIELPKVVSNQNGINLEWEHNVQYMYEGELVQENALAINSPSKLNDSILFDEQFRLNKITVSYYSSGKDWTDFPKWPIPQEYTSAKKPFMLFDMKWNKLNITDNYFGNNFWESVQLFVNNDSAYYLPDLDEDFVNVSISESKTYISKILDNDVIKKFMEVQKDIDYDVSVKNTKDKSMNRNGYYKSTQDNILLSSPVDLKNIKDSSWFGFKMFDTDTKYGLKLENSLFMF